MATAPTVNENVSDMVASLFREWFDALPEHAKVHNPDTADRIRHLMYHFRQQKLDRLEMFTKLIEGSSCILTDKSITVQELRELKRDL